MSTVVNCPICGAKSKIKERDGAIIHEAIQDEELIKKVGQIKRAMQKFKEKAEALEKELEEFKNK